MKVPGAVEVNKSLNALKRSLKACLQQVNQQAGRQLANGDYARAESLVEVAKSVDAIRAEVEGLHGRWRDIRSTTRRQVVKGQQTPLWEYYQPILQALVDLDGVARTGDLEPAIERRMSDRFTEGDLKTMAQGKPRWQVMIRRARKHMANEGLIDRGTGSEWRITSLGREAAATGKGQSEP